MSISALSLRRGKGGDTQHFSLAAVPNPAKATLLEATLTEGISAAQRSQVWSDPTNCSQFLCRSDSSFGFFTRPVISQHVDGDIQWVVGSFTDTIGQDFLVAVGFFTTLVRKDDVACFNLPIYPMEPEEVPGPPPAGEGRGARNQNADPVEGSMERLNWPNADGESDDGNPVIVVLPQFLPVGSGQTFPHHHPLVSTTSFRDTFPLLEI